MESIPTYGPTLSDHILSELHSIWLQKSSKCFRIPAIHYMGVILIFFAGNYYKGEHEISKISDFNTKHSACLYVRLG